MPFFGASVAVAFTFTTWLAGSRRADAQPTDNITIAAAQPIVVREITGFIRTDKRLERMENAIQRAAAGSRQALPSMHLGTRSEARRGLQLVSREWRKAAAGRAASHVKTRATVLPQCLTPCWGSGASKDPRRSSRVLPTTGRNASAVRPAAVIRI
jgi:hypothetical protein